MQRVSLTVSRHSSLLFEFGFRIDHMVLKRSTAGLHWDPNSLNR